MKLRRVIAVLSGLIVAQAAMAEQWREVGKSSRASAYVNMNSIKLVDGVGNDNMISYTNRIVSLSDSAGLKKGQTLESDVVDDCRKHQQSIYAVRFFDEDQRPITATDSSKEPLDIISLKRDTAQYQIHYELCQSLRNAKIRQGKNNDSAGLDSPQPASEWQKIAESKNGSVEIKLTSIDYNTKTDRASYLARYTSKDGKGGLANGMSMVVQFVANCKDKTQMRLSSTRYDKNGKQIDKTLYSGVQAKFLPVDTNSLSGSSFEYVCEFVP